MKKIIVLLAVFCIASAFAQNKAFYAPCPKDLLVPYEKELRSIYVKHLKTINNIDFVYMIRSVNLESQDIGMLSQLAAAAQAYSYNKSYDEKIINTMNAEIEKCYKKHKSKIEEAKICGTDLYKQLEKAVSELSRNESKNSKKEFETTEQYNQRLKEEEQMFKDNSEASFLKAINPVVVYIQQYSKLIPIGFEKYDADKGIYTIASTNGEYKGQIKISTEEAMLLKEVKDFKTNVNPSDVYAVNYDLYIRRVEISYGDKKYTAEFPEAKNMRQIVFRGSELWKENSAMKNVEFTLADALVRLEEEKGLQEKEKLRLEKLQEEKKLQEEEETKRKLAELSGVLTDERDGKKYKTIKIGTQTWMAENLNYKNKTTIFKVAVSNCYDNNELNCDKYGRLYDWNTAMEACPKGWHLPTNEEWELLYRFADGTIGTSSPYEGKTVGGKTGTVLYISQTAGKHLKAKSGWNENKNGLDTYGFAALPGGYHGSSAGHIGSWWSTSKSHLKVMGSKQNDYDDGSAGYKNSISSDLSSVRCLQDVRQ